MVEGGEKPSISTDDVIKIGSALETAKPSNADTLRALVASYRSSENPDWRKLAPSTKKLWSDCLDVILEKWGDVPLRLWNDPRMVGKVMAWRDSMAETPRAADNRVSTLYRLLEYGRLRSRLTVNVAKDIPTLYKGGNRQEVIWESKHMEAFISVAKTPISDAIRLAALTGLRRADLVVLRWCDVFSEHIEIVASKKSAGKRRKVVIPIIPGLRTLLDELKTRPRKAGVETVLVTNEGTPWTPTGLNSSFHEARKKVVDEKTKAPLLVHTDLEGNHHALRLHDLRGTFATHLMTIPGIRLTDREISEVMGWSEKQVAEIRRRYVDDAAILMALGRRLANIGVNPAVNSQDAA
jgi:integrase